MSSTATVEAEPGQAKAPAQTRKPSPLDEFSEVHYKVDILVGQAIRTLKQILDLKPGDIIALDRPAHENVLLSIEEIPIGLAEVVMSEKGSSLQITEVGSGE